MRALKVLYSTDVLNVDSSNQTFMSSAMHAVMLQPCPPTPRYAIRNPVQKVKKRFSCLDVNTVEFSAQSLALLLEFLLSKKLRVSRSLVVDAAFGFLLALPSA